MYIGSKIDFIGKHFRFLSLEVIQKCQHYQLSVLRENSSLIITTIGCIKMERLTLVPQLISYPPCGYLYELFELMIKLL